jgi:hypothetical protein
MKSLILACCLSLVGAAPAIGEQALAKPQTTFARAQVAEWLTDTTFAVARWDGTVTIFRRPAGPDEFGPMLVQALMVPEMRPVEMVGRLSADSFVTSNGPASLVVWTRRKSQYQVSQVLHYAAAAKTANSATVALRADGAPVFVTGHEGGFVLIWTVQKGKLRLLRSIDVRSPDPIQSGFPLKNVRGLAAWKAGYVVTGSEDGDLTLVRISDGAVITRLRYNPSAQRGINAISVNGDYLVVANCSVGENDRNLWLYRLTDRAIMPLDSTNLVAKTGLPQVFNFDVDFYGDATAPAFLASTEEGLLWTGSVSADKFVVNQNTSVACTGGAAIDLDPITGLAAIAAFDVMILTAPAAPPRSADVATLLLRERAAHARNALLPVCDRH